MKRLAFTLVEVCLAMCLLATAGTAIITVYRCKPASHCATPLDEDGNPIYTNSFCSTKTIAVLRKDGCSVLMMNFADDVACRRYCGTNNPPSAISDMMVMETQLWGGTNASSPFLCGEGTNAWVNTYDWSFRGVLHYSDDGSRLQTDIEATQPSEVFRLLEVMDYPPQVKLTK